MKTARNHKQHYRSQHRQFLPVPPRSILERKFINLLTQPFNESNSEAWHIITTTDPLIDSDEEVGDEHVRHDYSTQLFL